MSTTPPASPPPAGDDRNLVEVDEAYPAPSFEDKVQQFWLKNRGAIIGGCVVVLGVILIRGGWSWWQERQAAALTAAYAEATDDAGLQAFAADHDGTQLAGIAQLRLGDSAYEEGNFEAANGYYSSAQDALVGSPFAGRLQVGLAMVQIKQGNLAAGEAALQAVADDATAVPAIRAEATYHLASLASAAGDRERVSSLADRIGTISPGSAWSQRAMILLSTMPVAAGAAAAEPTDAAESPAVVFPGTP